MVQQILPAFPERLGSRCILHAFDKGVDLLRLDSCQIIAYADVKLVPTHAAKSILPGHECQEEPRLDIFFLCLRHIQFGGPLAVIALVIRFDAWLIHAGRQLRAVHNLHRLQFKEPAASIIGRRNILGQLTVGSGSRADRRLQIPSEDGQIPAFCRHIRSVYAKYGSFCIMLCPDPI